MARGFGDRRVIEAAVSGRHARAWVVDWCASRRDPDGLWTRGFQFGDWLDPDAPPDRPNAAKVDRGIVATAYLAYSAGLMAHAAGLLERPDEVERYAALRDATAKAAWAKWADSFPTTQTGAALALEFAIAPPAERKRVGDALAALVAANRHRIGTGFVGTPLLLPALTHAGHVEAAYKVLLNSECPGWLYQVDCGATTIWERWDGVDTDGQLHSAQLADTSRSMVSFNHYAYGSVAAWLYEVVAGLSIDLSGEGPTPLCFAPQPGGGLAFARAEVETPFGPAGIGWRWQGDELLVEAKVPPGATARLVPPPGFVAQGESPWTHVLGSGEYEILLRPGA